jgi:lysophospholipase L1-like esterase
MTDVATSGLTRAQARYFIQFIHPTKTLGMFPSVSGENIAAQMGIPQAQYEDAVAGFAQAVEQTSAALVADASFRAQVAALPFAPGDTVVALGDSITDDLQSWFELLRTAFALVRPNEGVRFVNAGISGDTTAVMISRFHAVTLEEPKWIICMAGTNDTRTHGIAPTRSLVSQAETFANYQVLRDYAMQETRARWVWLTPPPVIEAAIPQDWWLGPQHMMWRNAPLQALAKHLHSRPEPLIDVQAAFGGAPDAALYLADGLHPSLAGQALIARTVVQGLSALA